MIAAAFAVLLGLQTAPDAATATLDLADDCLKVMTGRAEAPAGPTWVALTEGLEARLSIGRNGCDLTIEDWADDGDAFAAAVRDGLRLRMSHWTVSQWREPVVNESGPTVWTTMVLPDVRRHSAYWVRIIEPMPGAPPRLSVSFGIGP